MLLRSRLAIAVAVGALATSAAVPPAVAGADSGDDPSESSVGSTIGPRGDRNGDPGSDPSGFYEGVVTAGTLALRSAPNRGSQIIRYAHKGDIVRIFCKTGGETIDGNPLWYLLPDGAWAWGSARYIDNIGPAPRWC